MTTSLKQPTSSINKNLRLMTTTTQISSSISLSIPLLIQEPNPTLLNINIFNMPLNLSDSNRLSATGANHVLGKSNRFDQAIRPTPLATFRLSIPT